MPSGELKNCHGYHQRQNRGHKCLFDKLLFEFASLIPILLIQVYDLNDFIAAIFSAQNKSGCLGRGSVSGERTYDAKTSKNL